jgi:Tfp pilus assembly protein PilN
MYTALNISSRNIKVLALSGTRVKTWATSELTSGLVRDGVILHPQAVGEAIDSLFKSTGISRKNVIASIAGLPFTYRFINLPKIKPSLVEEAILRAAKKEISLPLDDLYVTWEPTVTKGEEQEYFILGISRNTIDTLLSTLKMAKVDPYLIELRPLALARAANRSDAIIVNMESDCFDIVLVANGVPSVLHTLSLRGDGATLEDNIYRLSSELTKITAFNQSNSPNTQISPSTPLLLTGESAAEAMTSGLLQSQIEYQIEPLVPPVESPKNLPLAEYASSIGLALKKTTLKRSSNGGATHFHDININILAEKYSKPKAKPISMKSLLPALLLVVVMVLLYPLSMARAQVTNENQTLDTELTRINRQLNLAKLMNEQATQTEGTISETTALADALKAVNESILGTRGEHVAVFQLVTQCLPVTAFFTSIIILPDTITIKGEADNAFTVLQYAATLEAQAIFREVRIVQIYEVIVTLPDIGEGESTPEEATVIAFEINCIK